MPGSKRSKDVRFREEAKKRTQRVLEALHKLEECADRKRYEYTSEEAADVVEAINAAAISLAEKFSEPEEAPRFEWGQRDSETDKN